MPYVAHIPFQDYIYIYIYIVTEIRPEIVDCAGSIQVCAGQKAGCEAAAHAMNDIFNEAETDAVLSSIK